MRCHGGQRRNWTNLIAFLITLSLKIILVMRLVAKKEANDSAFSVALVAIERKRGENEGDAKFRFSSINSDWNQGRESCRNFFFF